MKLKLYLSVLTSLSILLFSCKSATKLYQKGNYDEAVELAAKKLQKDPDDPKLLDVLQSAYRFAVDDHQSRIRTNLESKNELRWEWTYNEYASLQRMYEAIYRVPQVYQVVRPVDYSSYLVTYAERAGDVRQDRALSMMQRGDKQSFRDAYREFRLALNFKPGDRDIKDKMAEAYDYAVVNVVILPVEEGGFRFGSYNNYNNYGDRDFTETLLRTLKYNSGCEFVKFYSSWDALSANVRADEIIDLRFRTINIGRTSDSRSKRRVSREVVIKETVYRPDSIVKEYGKVYAEITNITRTLHSEALLQVNIKNGDGLYLWSDNFTSVHDWTTEFSTYTGDERALSDSDKQLVNKKAEDPPSESQVMRYLMDNVENSALSRIRNHYNRL